ncbi:hypothetical protein FIBSPDRAFT_949312 [Athelia psychrophila]|uniref:Uncharacterized protein n=1 Tax=Athelia psychrophila TaxID=1759441 RepID=A0A166PTF8_9AGAM|nr:hypothetical protein FIBSPDRAFT_949312 [Fibularhizoctonia sp. CBS 109695]
MPPKPKTPTLPKSRSVVGQDVGYDAAIAALNADDNCDEPVLAGNTFVQNAPAKNTGMDAPPVIGTIYFCQFCGDYPGESPLRCRTCKVVACNAKRQGESGCIFIPADLRLSAYEFECPKCAFADKRAILYVHESYTRVPLHNKSIMPTVAVGLLLSTVSVTSEGWATLVTKLQMQFLWATHQLLLVPILMKAGPDNYKTAIRKQKEIAAFMEKVQNKCRVLVFVDTHANSGTGSLQITAAKPPKCVSIDVLLKLYLPLVMKRLPQVESSTLILQTCGPCVNVPSHFEKIMDLVQGEQAVFEVVLAFSGSSTVPQVLGGTLAEFGCARLTKEQDVEHALRDTIIGNYLLLKGSPPVWAVRNRQGPARAEMIGVHSPPDHVWGLELRGCPTAGCPWGPGDTKWTSTDPHNKAIAFCRRCKEKATIHREQDLPHVKRWGSAHPLIYRSRFPLTVEEVQIVMTKGKRIPAEAPGEGNRKRKQSQIDAGMAGSSKMPKTGPLQM